MRSLKTTQKKIDDLTNKLGEFSKKKVDTENELKEIHDLIKEETWIQNLDRVYLVKNDKTIRGKVYYRNKWRWIHVGQTQSLKDKSDIDLKKIVKDKFFKTLVSTK